MRLSLLYGVYPSVLEETLGARDWDLLLRFYAECDLPDGFLVTGVLASTVANLMGGKTRPGDFAPFYREPRPAAPARAPGGGVAAAFAFLREVFPGGKKE